MSRASLPTVRRLAGVALCALALAVAVGACGSSASTSSSLAAAGTGASSGSSASTTTARLNLAKCLRAHGIEAPDSGSTAGAGRGGGIFGALRNYPRAQIQAAMTACRPYMAAAFPRLNLTPAQQAARRAELVKYAECMRSHGVNIPDPTTSGGAGGGGFGFGAQGGTNFRALLNTPTVQDGQGRVREPATELRARCGRRSRGGGGRRGVTTVTGAAGA